MRTEPIAWSQSAGRGGLSQPCAGRRGYARAKPAVRECARLLVLRLAARRIRRPPPGNGTHTTHRSRDERRRQRHADHHPGIRLRVPRPFRRYVRRRSHDRRIATDRPRRGAESDAPARRRDRRLSEFEPPVCVAQVQEHTGIDRRDACASASYATRAVVFASGGFRPISDCPRTPRNTRSPSAFSRSSRISARSPRACAPACRSTFASSMQPAPSCTRRPSP